MYVFGDSYRDVVNFVNGVFVGRNFGRGEDEYRDFHRWFYEHQGMEQRSVVASHYILDIMANGDEEKATEILLKAVIEYFGD
jgi:hypothetical protein